MSIRNLIFGVNSVTVSDLIRYDSLLQNATDVITKCDSYFITKCDRSLLQNALGFLLQNATVLLQNATVITNCNDVITKCDSYYKMRRLLQIATVQHPLVLLVYFILFSVVVYSRIWHSLFRVHCARYHFLWKSLCAECDLTCN